MLSATALLEVAKTQPDVFVELAENDRVGGRVVVLTDDHIFLDAGLAPLPGEQCRYLALGWNPENPFRTVIPISEIDHEPMIPGPPNVRISVGGSDQGDAMPVIDDAGAALPPVPTPSLVRELTGAIPLPTPFTAGASMDTPHRIVPLRVSMAASLITQVFTLKQGALAFSASLRAESGAIRRMRPPPEGDDDEPWKKTEPEEISAALPTIQLDDEELRVYHNALKKLDRWMMAEDDDVPWQHQAALPDCCLNPGTVEVLPEPSMECDNGPSYDLPRAEEE